MLDEDIALKDMKIPLYSDTCLNSPILPKLLDL